VTEGVRKFVEWYVEYFNAKVENWYREGFLCSLLFLDV
jgi:hypothetical protein